jgi:tetratricopeptide (TPR) repeat protein
LSSQRNDAAASGSVPSSGRGVAFSIDRETLLLAGVLIATLLVYLRCLGDGFISDDRMFIVSNPRIGQWSFLWKSLVRNEYWFQDPTADLLHPGNQVMVTARYRPLMLVWMALNYRLFGLNPVGWHATGVMLHLVGVWLVFKITRRLTGQSQAALVAALMFGLLPGHAEAIAWSASVGVPLSAVFVFAAFNIYLGRDGDRGLNRLLAPACFGAAMMSHEAVAAFPALIGLHSLLLEPGADRAAQEPAIPLAERVGRAFRRMAPFAAILPLYFVARTYALGSALFSGRGSDVGLRQVLMTIPWVLSAYLDGIVIPVYRFYHHRVLFVGSIASPHFYLPLVALAVVGAAFWFAVATHPHRRLYLFCAGWTLISLAPMMYLPTLPEDGLVPDGYAYVASLGWCLLVGDWLTGFARRTSASRIAAQVGGSAFATACAVALWQNQAIFHDDFTLFTRCVEEFPEAYHCRSQLGYELQERGDLTGAAREFDTALSLHVDGPTLYAKGMLDQRLGRNRAAEQELASGLDLMRKYHPPAVSYVSLAELYDSDGDQVHAEAVLDFARSLPGGSEAVGMARARLRMRHGDAAGAERVLRDLTNDYPNNGQVWALLGLLMSDENRYQEAVDAFARAETLTPGDVRVHVFAAQSLHMLARDPEALDQCQRALAIDPGNAEARQLRDAIASGSAPH